MVSDSDSESESAELVAEPDTLELGPDGPVSVLADSDRKSAGSVVVDSDTADSPVQNV